MATHVNCVQVQLTDCIRELELQLLDLGFFQENQSFIEKCSKVVTSKIQEWVGDHKGDNDPPCGHSNSKQVYPFLYCYGDDPFG